jgi:hypothetical protein
VAYDTVAWRSDIGRSAESIARDAVSAERVIPDTARVLTLARSGALYPAIWRLVVRPLTAPCRTSNGRT